MAQLPMFPLGSVLFPSLVLPLHIFEPRYRALIRDVLAGAPGSGVPESGVPESGAAGSGAAEFGVCLIERGSEVGGGDVRLDVGTVARVREAVELADGRWAVVCVGTRRIVVDEWLEDDPYPRAEVSDRPDPPPDAAQLELLPEVTRSLRSALAKANELGDATGPSTAELSDDPVTASYQLCALAPISTIDRYDLLASSTVGIRLASLRDLLDDAHEVLDLRLAGEGPDAGRP